VGDDSTTRFVPHYFKAFSDSHMAGKKQTSKEKVLKAIQDSGGIISNVAKKLGCTWETASNYIKDDEDLTAALEIEGEVLLDEGENALRALIKKKDGRSVRYLLSTKGKKRGYGESLDINANLKGGAIVVPEQESMDDYRRLAEEHQKSTNGG